VIDSKGRRSLQTDVIVADEEQPFRVDDNPQLLIIEGVGAGAEVKGEPHDRRSQLAWAHRCRVVKPPRRREPTPPPPVEIPPWVRRHDGVTPRAQWARQRRRWARANGVDLLGLIRAHEVEYSYSHLRAVMAVEGISKNQDAHD